MSDESINLNIDSRGVARLKIARPDKMNALTLRMMRDFVSQLETVSERGARVVVISGEGSSFCAGMDIAAEREPGAIETVKALLAEIDNCPIATIAQVHGYALGGGLGIASATDFVVATDDARFGMPELRIGMAPLLVSVYASQRFGWATARRWALLACHFPADAAWRDGLVDRLTSVGDIDREVDEVIDRILETAPDAAKVAKRFLQARSSPSENTVLDAMKASAELAAQHEARSGAAAFARREHPPWTQ